MKKMITILTIGLCFSALINGSAPQKFPIGDLEKTILLNELYKRARPLGLSYRHYKEGDSLTESEAKEILEAHGEHWIDYLKGRVMKINLFGNKCSTDCYNKYNGENAAERVIDKLRMSDCNSMWRRNKYHNLKTESDIDKNCERLEKAIAATKKHGGKYMVKWELAITRKYYLVNKRHKERDKEYTRLLTHYMNTISNPNKIENIKNLVCLTHETECARETAARKRLDRTAGWRVFDWWYAPSKNIDYIFETEAAKKLKEELVARYQEKKRVESVKQAYTLII